MNAGCLRVPAFPRVPWLRSPVLQRALSRVSESAPYCTSENEPSQFPTKTQKQSPSPALGSPALQCRHILYAVTHFKVSQTVQLKMDMVTTSLSHSIWSCIAVIFFSIPRFLFLCHYCPFFCLQENLSEIQPWDHGRHERLTAQSPRRSHCRSHSSVRPAQAQAITHPSSFLLGEWCVARRRFLLWPLSFPSPRAPLCTPILFRAASSWSSFIARKDLCWWFKPDAVAAWPFL